MPNFKVRQEQSPGLPLRSSSVPPIHLHSPEVHHTLPTLTEQPTPTKPSRPKPHAFAWTRLPQHIRQRILAHALLPGGPDTPIAVGLPEHGAHLSTTALPIFLALGSWEAYVSAAAIFYEHVHLSLAHFQDSAMTFLTSPATLRPRSLIARIQLHFTIREHLSLFDTGYTVSHSMGKLIKMNIPTALRSMRTRGQLREVSFLILKGSEVASGDGREGAVPGYYFPVARIQLAGWTPVAESGDMLEPAEVIVAPAFLACRAFQSGLLPLLEDHVFETTRLALQSVSNAERDMGRDDNSTTAHHVDRTSFVQYWLGATVLELLDISPSDETWADPFPINVQGGGDADESMADVPDSEALPAAQDLVPSQETRYDLVSSPIKYPSSSSCSDMESSSETASINFDAMRDDSQQEGESANRREPDLSDNGTSSEDMSPSEEVVRELHKYFGLAPEEHDSTDLAGARNDFENTEDEHPSSSSDESSDNPSDDSSPSPAAMHLEIARAELITTLTAAAASDDTMEAIARATADQQLTSYGIPRGVTPGGPCRHEDTAVDCAALSDGDDDDDDIPRMPTRKVLQIVSRAGSTVPDETASGSLNANSTCLPGDDEADSDTDTETSSSTSDGDDRGDEVSLVDLSEDVFSARAGDETSFDVHGGSNPTNCVLASSSEQAAQRVNKDNGREPSVDLGLVSQASSVASAEPTARAETETPSDTKPDNTSRPQRTAPTTPPLARPKDPVKSKGTQTKGPPNKPAKTKHTTVPAGAANHNRVSKKRKALPSSSDGPIRESRSKRRKRARAAKEKQLQLAKRIEAEAAERERTLVN